MGIHISTYFWFHQQHFPQRYLGNFWQRTARGIIPSTHFWSRLTHSTTFIHSGGRANYRQGDNKRNRRDSPGKHAWNYGFDLWYVIIFFVAFINRWQGNWVTMWRCRKWSSFSYSTKFWCNAREFSHAMNTGISFMDAIWYLYYEIIIIISNIVTIWNPRTIVIQTG